jgi:membrane fusion protein, copper/silver efflux system
MRHAFFGLMLLGFGVVGAAADDRRVLYYRDPLGQPYYSAEPKKDAVGRDYIPVYEGEEDNPLSAAAGRKGTILYYRNPMGLPDTSPVPKKDSMGMDYLPVYEGEETDDRGTVRISPDRVQKLGVQSVTVEPRVLARTIRAVGTIQAATWMSAAASSR